MVRPGPPGPRGARVLAHVARLRRDRLGFMEGLFRRYGDIVGLRTPGAPLVLIADPEAACQVLRDTGGTFEKGLGLVQLGRYVGSGLLTNSAPSWMGQRAAVARLLQSDRSPGWLRAITAITSPMLDGWGVEAERGRPVEVSRDLDVLTLRIAAGALLGQALDGEAHELAWTFSRIRDASMKAAFAVLPWPRGLRISHIRSRGAARRLDRCIDGLRARLGAASRSAQGADAGAAATAAALSPEDLKGLLFAAYDTTSTTLAWALELLARHPLVAARCAQEIEGAGGEPSVDGVRRLAYLRAVLSEVLRLRPPVWVIPRRAVREAEVGGFRIPAGAHVLVSVYSIHRHRDHWEAPDVFRPERFLGAGSRPAAYLPFGHGPRRCAGASFGLLEALAVLALTVRRYRLEPTSGEATRPEPLMSLRPRGPLRLRLLPRAKPGCESRDGRAVLRAGLTCRAGADGVLRS